MFNFAYQDNFSRYIEYFIGDTPTHHSLSEKIFRVIKKYLIISFTKYEGQQEIKYPLSFQVFQEIFAHYGQPKSSEE